MIRKFQPKLTLAVLTCGLGMACADSRASVSYQIGNGGLESFNVSIDGNAYYGALAGGILINRTDLGSDSAPLSYVSVCTDIQGTLYLGATYTYDAPASFGTKSGIKPTWGANNAPGNSFDQINATKAIMNAAKLFYDNFSSLQGDDTTQKAALQLAVWAALYNTSTSGSVSSSGRFTFGGGDAAADTLATSLLAGLDGTFSHAGAILVPNPLNQGNYDGEPPQELLVREGDFFPPPTPFEAVPEASTMIAGALLLLPLGWSASRNFYKKSKMA